MRRRCQPIAPPRGTTLIEVLIVVVLLGFLGVWGSSMFSDNFRTVRIVESDKTNSDQMRYAMDRLSREIREIKFTSKAAGYAITSTLAPSANNLEFTRTMNGNDVTVTISLSGSDVTLGYSNSASATIAKQVTGFSMNFYTVDATSGAVSATTSVVDVRYVVLSLTTTDALSGQSITERTRITLRDS